MRYVGAYLVRGDGHTLDTLLDRLEKERVIERENPDLFARAYRAFGVAEAEELRGRVRARPIKAPQRIFALFVPSMTTEAQNALLKTLEEPAADAALFLVSPSPDMFLPTIRSRAQRLELAGGTAGELLVDADDFLAASAEKRVTMLKPLYEHDEDEAPPHALRVRGEGRDIGAVLAFLHALERRFAAAKPSHERNAGIHAIYRARKYATDKGSLLKSLLEQVALLAPRV